MKFISTRGRAPAVGFSDAILNGLAPDGGLYLPETWPQVDARTVEQYANWPYSAIAAEIIGSFFEPDELPADLHQLTDAAYATFRHPSVTPLVEIGTGRYILELFHGPTLSFKDVAMQIIARLMDALLKSRGRRATIVGATSGDTGSAAIEAFRGRDSIDVFILHPKGRTSAIQRRQMTTVLDRNVHNIALEGTFDDCQRMLKAMFANAPFRDAIGLTAVNSINFGRIASQIAYYFKAAAQLGAPHRRVGFTVPTGNFGDIFAGFAASQMGLPLERLVIATNSNDILYRAMKSGRYEVRDVVPTSSPSMDIQVSSNFERLLFEASGRDGPAVEGMMQGLAQSGAFSIPPRALAEIRSVLSAGFASENDTRVTIKETRETSGYLLDPHTAVGVSVAGEQGRARLAPMVTLATAHPAKFPDAVKAATGIEPALPLWLADLNDREERYDVLPNDQGAVEAYVRDRTRVLEDVR
jgi:threonine synthase